MRRLLVPSLWLAVAIGVAGCGSGSSDPDEAANLPTPLDYLPGEQVGEMAEKQLEAEHLQMAVGSMTCPDLDWKLDAFVRCVKVAELSDGRRVTIPGTVSVTSVEGGGKLHVSLDDRATGFGIAGDHLSAEVVAWVKDQAGVEGTAACPYLVGVVGTVVRCPVSISEKAYGVAVTVTAVDDQEYRTTYSLSWKSSRPGS